MSEEISVGNLVELIGQLLGVKLSVSQEQQRVRADKSEVQRLKCDNSKLKKLTNWAPDYNLTTGLQETIEFLKNNLIRYKPEIYNV